MNKTWERECTFEYRQENIQDFLCSKTHKGPIPWPSIELQDHPRYQSYFFYYYSGLDSFCLPVNNSLKRVVKEIQNYREKRGKEE